MYIHAMQSDGDDSERVVEMLEQLLELEEKKKGSATDNEVCWICEVHSSHLPVFFSVAY